MGVRLFNDNAPTASVCRIERHEAQVQTNSYSRDSCGETEENVGSLRHYTIATAWIQATPHM
jgi:hypothetical protein